MANHIKDVIENTKEIYMSDSALSTLMDFERVLDELDMYVFKNWKAGELVAGPAYEKYFVTCTFMWPHKLMPDPRGAERLQDYDCEIKWTKDVLEYPVKVKDPSDYKPGTKVPKLGKVPVWLVEITMPKKLMFEIERGSLELESESIEAEDIESAYETGADNIEGQGQDTIGAAAVPAPGPQPAGQPAPPAV
jgi:hypothetical protein